MGLKMDDIHTPTVPSGPTSGPIKSSDLGDGMSLTELIADKERVEGELTALSQVLESVRWFKPDGYSLLKGYEA